MPLGSGHVVIATTNGRGASNSTNTETATPQPARQPITNDSATAPTLAMSGSEAGLVGKSPALAPRVSQPQARGGAVNTNPPAPAPASQPAAPAANAGAIRPLSMAPTNSSGPSAPAAAIASGDGAEQRGRATLHTRETGHGTGIMPMTSGGGNGGLTGSPFIAYSGGDGINGNTKTNASVTDLIGDGVQLSVGDGNDYEISTVSWTVSTSSIYTSPNINERTGFMMQTFTPPQSVRRPRSASTGGKTPGVLRLPRRSTTPIIPYHRQVPAWMSRS